MVMLLVTKEKKRIVIKKRKEVSSNKLIMKKSKETNVIICHLHKIDVEECKKDLIKIKEHINYARERTDTCFMKGDLAFWRQQKKKIKI